MPFDFLKIHHGELLQNMTDTGYSKSYRRLFELVSRNILENAHSSDWKSFYDVYNHYCEKGMSKVRLKAYACVIGSLMKFENEHTYPVPGQRVTIAKVDKYDVLTDEFKGLIDHFTQTHRELGNAKNTVHGVYKTGAFFLYSMQERGCRTLSSIMEEDVMSHFHTPDGGNRCGYGTAELIRRLFKCGLSWKHDECAAILAFIPKFPRSRKILPYLREDEIIRLRDYIDNPDTDITFRDKAIILTLIFTGMRRGDISGMKLDDIDWENGFISIEQEKTQQPVTIPLIPVLGNALYDYLVNERNNSNDPRLFLSTRYSRMSAPISGAAINSIIKRIFAKAGIRQANGDRIYPHLFRHHMASSMLESSIPQPVISRILGHESPSSTENYLMADFVHLKECAISIERYPVAGEVFEV
jgi:site-specific recombinase XerD